MCSDLSTNAVGRVILSIIAILFQVTFLKVLHFDQLGHFYMVSSHSTFALASDRDAMKSNVFFSIFPFLEGG